VLYVTITDWGIGDELALQGAIHLMEQVRPGHLKFYGNKNPELRVEDWRPFKSDVWNCFQCDFPPDLVVYAGGCAWTGRGNELWERPWPSVYLGVGGGIRDDTTETRARAALAECLLFVGRDDLAVEAAEKLGAMNVVKLCCPSLLIQVRPDGPVAGRVGFVYQSVSNVRPHSCGSDELHNAQVRLIRQASASGDTLIICHWIGDYARALHLFPEWVGRIVYSRLLLDYERWYASCERLVTMRFHGAHFGAALGRPTVCIKEGAKKSGALEAIGVPVLHPSAVALDDDKCFSDPVSVATLKAGYLERYLSGLRAAVEGLGT